MHVLQNELIKLSITDNGTLQELTNSKTGQQYAGGGMLWRLYFQRGDQMDRERIGTDCIPQITAKENKLVLVYDRVKFNNETLK